MNRFFCFFKQIKPVNFQLLRMKFKSILLIFSLILFFSHCRISVKNENPSIRGLADTIGFAHLDWQMDSVMSRIDRQFGAELKAAEQPEGTVWKTAICPHDDYTYSSWLYPAVLRYMKAKTIIIFGVAHKAANFNLENQIVFDSFKFWHGPYGNVKVSPLREQIIKNLPESLYVVHDSMQQMEHSVEALIPFLQVQNHDIEILSILVPYMSQNKMDTLSKYLAVAIKNTTDANHLSWGSDYALLITTDAVHYGDEEWGGKNYAPFGTDSLGYKHAIEKEYKIITNCLVGPLENEKINQFINYTVKPDNFKEYQWTWCGRYSVPFGLKTALNLQQINMDKPLSGINIGYQNSIDHPEIKVDDLLMERTAIATSKHWVGYAAVGFF